MHVVGAENHVHEAVELANALCHAVFLGHAAAYANDRYVDLKWNQTVFSVNQSDLLVKPHVAKAQVAKEKQKKEEKQAVKLAAKNTKDSLMQ